MRAKSAFFLLLCLSLLLVGCGTNTLTTTSASSTTTSISVTPKVVTPITPGVSASPSVTISPPGISGSSQVTVQTSASLYHPGDTIVVTVSNHTAQSIFFPNHQTNCTVVLLQRQVGSSWEPIAACKLMIVTIIQSLNGEKSLLVPLKAGHPSWAVGTYRIAFHYMTKTASGIGTPLDVFSPLFQVS